MDEKQQVEPAGGIQDALTSLMAVEPSPGFTARVRQRIAADADAREWRPIYLIVTALGAVAIVVLGVLLTITGTRRIAPEQLMSDVPTRVAGPESAVSAPSSEPERSTALIPRNEIIAVQQLLSAAQAGRFAYELVPAGVPVATELSVAEPISAPPIELIPFGTSPSFE